MRKALILLGVLVATVGDVVGVLYTALEGADRWWPSTWLVWAPVGAFILWRRPGNRVGRIQLTIGVAMALAFGAEAVAVTSTSLDVRAWSEWVSDLVGITPWLGIVWLILIFPSGRLSGQLGRVAGAGLVVACAYAVFAFTFTSTPMDVTGLRSPLSEPALDAMTAWFVSPGGFSIILLAVLGAIASLVSRWRSSTGEERSQYRWLFFGAALFALIQTIGLVAPEDNQMMFLWIAGQAVIPLSVGVAITRYRLYEIDRIISRTLAYALIVAVLGAVFAVGVVAVPNLVIGDGSAQPLVVAASTLAVAALFNPVRRRALRWVDRRFNRSIVDAERVMDEFVATLREQADESRIVDGWQVVVSQTMQPRSVGVWVR